MFNYLRFLVLVFSICHIAFGNNLSEVLSSSKQTVTVRGTIVDEDGLSLNGVTVEVTKKTMISFTKSDFKQESVVCDGSFSIEATNVHSVFLNFKKEDYHTESRSISLFTGDNCEGLFVVVMQKIGKVVPLDYARFEVIYKFAENAITFKILEDHGGLSEYVRNILLFPSIVNGKVAVRMTVKSEADGIIQHSPVAGARKRFERLQEAPSTGYVQSVIVDKDNANKIFFFKIDNIFSKGRVISIIENKKNGEVLTYFELYANPNGDRNLVTK